MGKFGKFFRLLGIERGFVSVAGANITSQLILGLFWLFLASFVEPKDYGQLNYFTSFSFVTAAFILLGLNTTVMTFLPKGEEMLKNKANHLVLLSSCAIILPIFLLTSNVPSVVLAISTSIFIMTQAGILGLKNYKRYYRVAIGQRLLLVALSLLLYYTNGIDGIIIGFAISQFLFSYDYYKSLRGFNLNFKELRPKFRFIVHMFFSNLESRIILYVDKLVIGSLFGLEILGLYQFGFQFLMFLSVIPLSIQNFLLPQMSSGIYNQKIIRTSLLFALMVSIISFLVIPYFIRSFFPLYQETIQAAQIMVLGIFPITVNSTITPKLLANKNSQPVFVATMIRLVSLFPLILFLGRNMGLLGLAISVVISISLQTIFLIIASKKH